MSTADDAWQEWEAEHYGARGANAETQRLFKSAYRRALEDAADALANEWIANGRHYGLPGAYSPGYERWLRDRAAAVGTKDGDDDRPHVHQWIQAQTEWGTPYKYCSCGERYLL